MILRAAMSFFCACAFTGPVAAQSLTFAGNSQHTANYSPAARNLNRIIWSAPNDLNNTGALAHYGAPLITAANTVVLPVKTGKTGGYRIDVFNGANGASRYSLTTDYILPSYQWIPVYQPVVTGTRLYYPGAGGTVYYIDGVDSANPGNPTQRAFYGLSSYQANMAGFNNSVFINTPITADSSGNIFFGFRVQGTAPSPLSTNQSGFARIAPDGTAIYVLAGDVSGDASIQRDSHNSAPALSTDGATLYVPVKSGSTEYYGYLLGLNSATLALKYKVFLKDPRSGGANNAGILDVSTASPTVAPDGDVYFGIFANPDNGSRGFLLRFSSDLTIQKTSGGFGWDYTPAIVPATMAPLYTGTSSYLIFAKYNNYVVGDGNGVNRIALIDPNATQIDPHSSANGLVEMREVLTVVGPTPDSENPTVPNAVREWCINTAAVNPATNSIFTPSEDGHIYRWNLSSNSLSQTVSLSAGFGEPYVPTAIGPDGTVYTLNGGNMFALGDIPGVGIAVASSVADVRTAVAGQSITFTATVTGPMGNPTPTGMVTFSDTVFFLSGSPATLMSTTTVLGSVALSSGTAAIARSDLSAANHFISAAYSGDGNYSPGTAILVQKIHASGSTTTLSSTQNPSAPGQAVTFTATVAPVPPGSATPTGMVAFQEGSIVLAQLALNTAGMASFTTSSLSTGTHGITASYASDSIYASSSGSVSQVVQQSVGSTTTSVTSSPNPSFAGQSVTFTARVTSSSGTPTGSVTFKDGTATLATGVGLDGTGNASFSTSALAVGAHSITATYGGSMNFLGSTSAPLNQTVNKVSTTTTITTSLDPASVGQTVTFTAVVSSPVTPKPTGIVTFLDKGKSLGTGVLDATGRTTFPTSRLTQGAHQITASYSGDANFAASTSSTLIENIKK